MSGVNNLIEKALRIKGKPQVWLAKKSGLSRVYINKLIRGKVPNPTIQNAHNIAQALGCTIEDLWIFD